MKKYYIKHEDYYFAGEVMYSENEGFSFAWSNFRENAKLFIFREDALKYSAGLRKGPRQFGGLGSKARVISVGT